MAGRRCKVAAEDILRGSIINPKFSLRRKKNNVSSLRKGKRKEKENTNSLTNISGNLKLFQVEISLFDCKTLCIP